MTSEIRLQNRTPAELDIPSAVSTEDNKAAAVAVPQAKTAGADPRFADCMGLPVLAAPAAALNMDTLLQSLNFTARRESCRQGLDSIDANAQAQKKTSAEMIAKMQENLQKMDKANVLQGLLQALGFLALVVSAVVTVATLGSAAPVMAAVAVLLLANSVASYCSDGKVSIAGGVAAIARKCGASEEVANWIGIGFEVALSLGLMVASVGPALCRAASSASAAVAAKVSASAAQAGEKTLQTVLDEGCKKVTQALNKLVARAGSGTSKIGGELHAAVEMEEMGSLAAKSASSATRAGAQSLPKQGATVAKHALDNLDKEVLSFMEKTMKALSSPGVRAAAQKARLVGSIGEGVLGVATGGVSIERGNILAEATHIQADTRKLEALLTRLREYADMEQSLIKTELERCNALVDSVMKIVNTKNDALERVVTNTHALA